MNVVDLFPQFFRDADRYPYMAATGEVTQIVLQMYYKEVAEAIKNLYDLDGSYYADNISSHTWRSKLAKENLDKLIETFLPFASDFLTQADYADKKGILSFSDSFFSTKGTMTGLFSLFNFLGLPISVYTREGEHGSQNVYNSLGEVQLEKLGDKGCYYKRSDAEEEYAPVYNYFPGKWECIVAGKSVIFPNEDGKFEYLTEIPGDVYNSKPIDFVIDGFIKVEAGKSYSYLIGSDDGAFLEIGDKGSIGKCVVPAEGLRTLIDIPGETQDYAKWDNLDSWRVRDGYKMVNGHAFTWGSNWISWESKEDGYVPIKIRKQMDGGGVFAFKLIGGETTKVQASIKTEVVLPGNNKRSVNYNTLPRFPSSCFDNANNNWGEFVYALNHYDGGDEGEPQSACDYFEAGSLLSRKEKRVDPAGFLGDYDIVISINLTNKKNILDIEKANQESWQYYGKSLQQRIEELVKEFTWICSDVIAYLYYTKQDVINLIDKVDTKTKYLFNERTPESSVRRMMLTICRDKNSPSVQRVKPPAGYHLAIDSNDKLSLPYLESVNGEAFKSLVSNEVTSSWVGVSSVVGDSVPDDPELNTADQKLRVAIKPDNDTFDPDTQKLTVFAKGGVFTGKNSVWYEQNPDIKTWVNKDRYRLGEAVSEDVELESYAVNTSNVAESSRLILPNNIFEDGISVEFRGSASKYPTNVFVTDKLKVTPKYYRIAISPTTLSVESTSSSHSIHVNTSASITLWSVSSADTWVVASKSGNNTAKIEIQANETTRDRSTTVTFKGNNDTTAVLTVYQEQTQIKVSPSSLTFEDTASSKTVEIVLGQSNDVTVDFSVSTTATWLSANKSGSVSVTANTSTDSRNASVVYTTNTGRSATVEVTQLGKPYIRVVPSEVTFNEELDAAHFTLNEIN